MLKLIRSNGSGSAGNSSDRKMPAAGIELLLCDTVSYEIDLAAQGEDERSRRSDRQRRTGPEFCGAQFIWEWMNRSCSSAPLASLFVFKFPLRYAAY